MTTSTTIDLAPLLALRPQCEAWALRFASDQAPTEPEWALFEAHHDGIVNEFVAALLVHVDQGLTDRERGRIDDAILTVANGITGVGEPNALAEEAFDEIYSDRDLMRLLQMMRERGSSIEDLREALAEHGGEMTDDGRQAARDYLAGLA